MATGAYEIIKGMDTSSVIGVYLDIKKSGSEYIGVCPFHDDKKPSLTINNEKKIFKCFSCGAAGDALEFVKKRFNLDAKDAIKKVESDLHIVGNNSNTKKNVPQQNAIDTNQEHKIKFYECCENTVRTGDNLDVFNIKLSKMITLKPVMAHHFTNLDGKITGVEIRILKKDGSKITPVIRRGEVEGSACWIQKGFDGRIPLYNLHRITNNTKSVILVEGAKCADALIDNGFVATTWSNGIQSIKKVDFSPIYGRTVYLWPDNDKPGIEGMHVIGDMLIDNGCTVKIINIPSDFPDKFDVADGVRDGWGHNDIKNFITDNRSDYVRSVEVIVTAEPVAPEPEQPPAQSLPSPPIQDAPRVDYPVSKKLENEDPFVILGHNHGIFYYLPADSAQIVELSAAAHTVNNLLLLAPLGYWCDNFEGKPFNLNNATNALMQRAKRVGIYDPDRVRGRGAWLDNGRLIVHEGTHATVDGVRTALGNIASTYVYEADYPFRWVQTEPATDEESQRLLDICNRLNWEKRISGHLLAGWIAIAPVCGALKWRPHIWVTGFAGSGKSTIVDNVVYKIVGDVGVKIQGNTTEAAIRGTIRRDARPVIFDEAENEDKKSADRMASIIGLARAGSSGGEIAKGSSNHKTVKFTIRSCFCFSSINTSIKTQADMSRLTKLLLLKNKAPDAAEHFKKLESDMFDWFTDEYSSKMLNRSVQNLPTLLKNIETFTQAVSVIMRDRRVGDQLGTLLAGAYLCKTTNLITYDNAVEFVRKIDWNEHVTHKAEDQEMEMMIELMHHSMRIKYLNSTSGLGDRRLGQVLSIAMDVCSKAESELWDKNDIIEKLDSLGIRIVNHEGEKRFLISTTHPGIKHILRDTPFVDNINEKLKTTRYALSHATTRFSGGVTSRGWSFPAELLTGDDRDD